MPLDVVILDDPDPPAISGQYTAYGGDWHGGVFEIWIAAGPRNPETRIGFFTEDPKRATRYTNDRGTLVKLENR